MPELPEVEVTGQGIRPLIVGKQVTQVIVRQPQLRWPVVPETLQMQGQTVISVERRAKYLMLNTAVGTLILHLGMSGSLRVLEQPSEAGKHDHLDLVFEDGSVLRLNDPRRFGAAIWWTDPVDSHPLIASLGPEPLTSAFNADYLAEKLKGKKKAIKLALMDNHVVVGVGNIYANEALFCAGIDPRSPCGSVSQERLANLVDEVKTVLARAITQGGTTLKDFSKADGKPGYFAQELLVYGRGGEACSVCQQTLSEVKLGQRATVFCDRCQK